MNRISSNILQFNLVNFFIIISILIIFTSCSAPKELKQTETKPGSEVVQSPIRNCYKSEIQSLIFLGNFSLKSEQLNFDGTFKMGISRNDSLVLYINGPFNVSIAKLLIYKSNFAICNLWEGTYYTSSIDSLKNVSPLFSIPLSNIISLFLPEPFYRENEYTLIKNDTIINQFEYKSTPANDFVEKLIIKKDIISTKTIQSNSFELIATYDNYVPAFIFQLPGKISVIESNQNINIAFKINKFENYNTDFSNEFKIPSNLKKISKMEDILK